MLCQFTVKNFKSIRDEVTFDMQAAAISEREIDLTLRYCSRLHIKCHFISYTFKIFYCKLA